MSSSYNKKSIRFSWIISYSFIISLFLIALLGTIFVSRSTIKEEITKNNSHVISLLDSEFHRFKQDLDSLSTQLSTNSAVSPLLEPITWDGEMFLKLKESSYEIANMLMPYQVAESVCIYNPASDIFLIGSGIIPSHTYYKNFSFSPLNSSSYDEWKKGMLEKHFHELYKSDTGELLHVTSVVDNKGNVKSVIIITVSQLAFERLADTQSNNFEDIIILNHLNQPVFSQTKGLVFDMTVEGNIDFETENKTYSIENEAVIVQISGRQSNIRCIYAIAENTVYKNLNILITAIMVCLVPLIVVIVWLMFFYSKKHYRPIGNLLAMLTEYQNKSDAQNNEFAIIEDSLNNLIYQERNGQRIKENYQKKLFEEDFSAYLNTDFYHRSLTDLLALYDINFLYRNYTAAIISISSINEEIWYIDDFSVEESNERLIPLAITNIYDEILSADFHLLAIKTRPDTLFCLIGSDKGNTEQIQAELEERTNSANRTISEKIGIDSFVYISECFSELEKTRTAYKQLSHVSMFEQISDTNNKKVLLYKDFKENTKNYHLELEFEGQLANAINSATTDDTKRALLQLLDDYGDILSASQFIIIKHALLNKLIDNSLFSNTADTAGVLHSLIEQVDHITTVKQLRNIMPDIVDVLAKTMQTLDVTDLVKEYVDKNFADSNLNINMLGETFSLTPSYLSNLFKMKKGEMLKEYIKKVRLAHAKELLKTDMKIEEVAKNSGFVDSKLFIRTFKLYYNVTPGQYRKDILTK